MIQFYVSKDPEMMEEAKKMMENPEWKAEMKRLEKSKEYKDALKRTKEMMDDPSTAAKMQAQMEHMLQRGQDQIKKGAKDSLSDAMQAMNDPAMMAEAKKLMSDPAFQDSMQNMMKDPNFQTYINAVSLNRFNF